MEQDQIIVNLKIANDMMLRLSKKMEKMIDALLKHMEEQGKRTNDQQ